MSAPLVIPDHTLRRPIGRGAYGEVWLARNVMGTPRAVKIVWRKQFQSDRPYEREFSGIQGYEPVSRSADGLVHVLHVGRNDKEGYFYYVMELADSTVPMADDPPDSEAPRGDEITPLVSYAPRTLRSDMKRLGRLPVADCLSVALDVVRGLARLHDRGLVHRDVKPGNIIFIDGRAKLADIGLVSRESEGRTFVGTEGYIPPEGPGAPGADLYALGMVLYEAVTGYPPEEFPKVPTDWFIDDGDPDALEFHAIVLKACEGAKERRYQNADEMQADLALLHSGRSVRQLRALEERVGRWRRIGWVAAMGVIVAVATALTANWRARMAAHSQAKEARLLEDARNSLARAENAERESRQQLYSALLEQARATVRSGEMGQRVRALTAIQRAAAISNSTELRREAIAALSLPDLRFEREVPIGPEPSLIQLDPTFERIALSRRRGPVEIRAVADDRLLAELPASTNLLCFGALWSSDGRFFAVNRDYDSTGYRSDLEVWDLKGTPRRVLLMRDARWKARAFHPNRPQFLAAGADGLIVAWNLETGEELGRKTFEVTPEELAYSPDGSRTAASYRRTDGYGVSVHHANADGTMICSNVFTSHILSLSWHPSGRWLALADEGGAIHLMDTRTGGTRILGRHKAVAVNTTFNADGRYLVTGAWGREMICWDIIRNQRAFNIDVESFFGQFRADGSACAFLTPTAVYLYAFERPEAHRELPEEMLPQTGRAAFSPDGRWLAASCDQRLGVWDLSGSGPGTFADYATDARMFWTGDGELFGSSRTLNCFRWRVHAATNVTEPPVLERMEIRRPSGFGSVFADSNVVAWTTAKGSQIRKREHPATDEDRWVPTIQGVNGVSADGRWLAIYAPYTRYLSVYRLPGLEHVARLTNQARISSFSFSPAGDELAVASSGQVEFWSTATWERARMATNVVGLPGVGALFQPDGRRLWLAKNLRTASLCESSDFQPVLPLPKGLIPVALTANGRYMAASFEGRRLQVWDLEALHQNLANLGLAW